VAEEVSDASSVSVAGYRSLLAQRHRADGVVGPDAVQHAELVFNLSRLHGRLAKDFEALHRRRGWSWAGFRIMNVLWAVGAAELREIARLSGASRAAISSALNTLERDGLVLRERDRADGRLVRIGLTERGRAELRDGMREQAERERAWFVALPEENRQQLVELLGTLADQPTPK
jgi:DNA-binding MarR family transcriptional regulator